MSRWLTVLGVAMLLGACGDDSDDSGSALGNTDFGNAAGGPGSAAANSGDGTFGPTGAAGTRGPSGACAEGSARTSRVKPRVVLVVDGSCSMSTPYPGNGGPSATMCTAGGNTRWAELRNALLSPGNGVVPRLQAAVEFGLVIFGTQPSCPFPGDGIDPALNNGATIDAAFPNAPPGMFTPTGAALDWVYDNMFTGTVLDYDQGPQIVILATDGEPNSCDNPAPNYQPSVDALNKGAAKDITTYVISLAASTGEFHDHLQQLATIGEGPAGGGDLYEPTTPEDLAADLELLIGGAVGCDLALAGWVRDGGASQGSVTLNGKPIPYGDPNGWELPDERHIRLVGSACQELMNAADAALDAKFPCSVFTPD